MPVNIPGGFMHVIQPFRLATANKSWTTTYAVAGSDPEGMITEADTIFRTNWRPNTDNSFSMEPAIGYFRQPGGDLQLVQSDNEPVNGSASRASAPPNVTFVISKRTAFVGRKQRGRCFIPLGVAEGNVDEAGNLTPAQIAVLQGAATDWRNDLNSAVAFTGMRLLHSDVSLAPSLVTQLVVQPVVRTQRRRLP